MAENPFDRCLPPEAKERVEAVKSFHKAQADGADLVHNYWLRQPEFKAEWKAAKRDHHNRRTEEAEDREATLVISAAERKAQDEEDDRRFAGIEDEDELLELTDHEDYLAGRRALARRPKLKDLYLKGPKDEEENTPRWTGRKLWAASVTLLFGYVFLYILAHDPKAVIVLPFFVLAGISVIRLGIIYFGGGGSWGGSRGASGNAV